MSYGHFYNHNLPSLIRQIRMIKRFRQPKFYAVAVGRRIGIYRNWPSCKVQIENISNAKYRRFDTHEEALEYLKNIPPEVPLNVQEFDLEEEERELGQEEKLKKSQINDSDNNNNNNLYLIHNNIKNNIQNNKNKKHGIVYIDGSCWRNGTPLACAGIGVYWPGLPEQNQSLTIDGRQTSIRAEIWAAIIALRQAKNLGLESITIYTDSHFVIQTSTIWLNKWKKNSWKTSSGDEVKNRYDMMALDDAIKGMKKIYWRSVPSHSGIHGNEESDRLANAAIASYLAEKQQQQQQLEEEKGKEEELQQKFSKGESLEEEEASESFLSSSSNNNDRMDTKATTTTTPHPKSDQTK